MSNRRLILLFAAVAAAALAITRQIASGSPSAAVYALAVVFAYGARSARWVWITAGVCSLLAIGGSFFTRDGDPQWGTLTKSLFAIWAPAYPCAVALAERTERERLASIINWSGDAIISRTLDGTLTSWNHGAEALYGYREDEMIGSPHATLVPPDRQDEIRDVLERLRLGEPIVQYETVRLRKGGRRIDVSLTISPISDTEGKLTGAATIARDVTERKALAEAQSRMSLELERHVQQRTVELARANEALERSNMELQQFAYVASHDLQTPLRGIVGFAQFLRSDYGDLLDATAQDYLERIVGGATRLQRLIQDLLEFSRVESRASAFGPVDLNEVFGDVVDGLRASIEDSSAQVTRALLPNVQGDRVQLTHLLQNLIENGIKYRREAPPQVRVSAQREGDGWRISVTDNGIGIAPEHHERIFEIFRRLHTAHAYPGTGIGLSLCRRIVSRHGGRIWVEGNEDSGSSFHFTVPDAGPSARAGATGQDAGGEVPSPAATHSGGGN